MHRPCDSGCYTPIDRNDPSTWRRPNLDTLKASAAVKARFSEVIAEEQPVLPKRDDPNTWSRPNLDNLKASILADWKTSA